MVFWKFYIGKYRTAADSWDAFTSFISSSSLTCPMLEHCCLDACSPGQMILSSTPCDVWTGTGGMQIRFYCMGPYVSQMFPWPSPGCMGSAIAAPKVQWWSSPASDLAVWQNRWTCLCMIISETGVQPLWPRTAWLETWSVKLMWITHCWQHTEHMWETATSTDVFHFIVFTSVYSLSVFRYNLYIVCFAGMMKSCLGAPVTKRWKFQRSSLLEKIRIGIVILLLPWNIE